jgi:5-methylcytosine-specific restriction protein A
MPQLPAKHAARPPAPRGKTKERGYGGDWRKLRTAYIHEHPLCEECERRGELAAASEVDHKRPFSRGGGRLDWDNLQALCKPCHVRKTTSERL